MDDDDYYNYSSAGSDFWMSDSDQESESLDGLENADSDAQRGPSRPPSSKIIRKESLLDAQKEDLRRVMELVLVKEHHARTLLIHYRWDVERLISVYVERGKSYMFSEAGVTAVEIYESNLPEPSSARVMCNVCMEDVPSKHSTRMDCGHCFCNNCWTLHFIVKINEGQSKRIRCMAHKCNAICDEAIIRKLVSVNHPDLAEKFERFLLESYIEDNKMVKWCPSVPHCGNAIRVENDQLFEVECSCGLQFCFSCLSEAHSPCSCSMWVLWKKKFQDVSDTVNWLTVNTKVCPKCLKLVEKNGGCNLVRCICGQAFCWMCGGATGQEHTWSTIANHSCGRYKESGETKAEFSKSNLYRYMHYHSRYKTHIDSSKQESKLQKTIKEKVQTLEARDSKLRDFSWVTNGLYRLFWSRRALSYSYPFAFYMFGDEFFHGEMTKNECEMKQHLFEDQQQQLEANVERLSMFYEEPFDEYSEEQVMKIRMKVINLCVVIDGLCRKMYECIESDLLGSLQCTIHNIAPYQSKGIEKAEELMAGNERSSGKNVVEIGQSSRKRSRGVNNAGNPFNLNLPAEANP